MSEQVDVVIPNYNKVEFIRECIQSLKNQTYENWNCIFVDGYSDDGSWEIIREAAKDDHRFQAYQLERIGLYKSWNWGLRKVESPYFAVLTSDDKWSPKWLEVAISSLRQHENAIAAAARTKYIDSSSQTGSIVRRNAIGESIFSDSGAFDPVVRSGLSCSIACYFMGTIFGGIHSFVGRSKLLDDLQFPTDVGTAGDLEWCMRLGLHGDIVYCPHISLYWRTYDKQASSRKMGQRKKLGKNIVKMVKRTKPKIERRLNDRQRQLFEEASERYIEKLLPCFFSEPPLEAFKTEPLRAGLKAIQVAFLYPTLFVGELRNLVQGRERYLLEQRAALVRQVLDIDEL